MSESTPKRTDVNELGEFGLIEHLTKGYKTVQKSTLTGVGDDGAILDHDGLLTVVSTDLLVEGIHFDLMYVPLKHLGYKSVIVNLSDICAMNAIPKQITMSIALSNRFSVEAMEEFYKGVYAACNEYGVDLVGGDTTSSTKGLIISVTALGVVDAEHVTYRYGAKKGDIICVTGDLGAAYLGLQILEREKQLYVDNPNIKPDLEEQDYLIRRQLKPEARTEVINDLRKADLIPTSMIDISDGLASDLKHILTQSKVGANIEEVNIPIRQEAELMAIKFKLDPVTTALSGGEDYELLFTIDPKDFEKIQFMASVKIIGEITDEKDGYNLISSQGNIHPVTAQGWKHLQ